MPMLSRAAYVAVTALGLVVLTGCGGTERLAFQDRGVEFRYPVGWSVTGFSRTVSPARLVVASYRVTPSEVEGDCAGHRALASLPGNGAALLLIDYGTAHRAGFAPPPKNLRMRQLARGNYECFGDSYMLRFKAAGHDFQAHLKLGENATASTRQQALQILDSVDRATQP